MPRPCATSPRPATPTSPTPRARRSCCAWTQDETYHLGGDIHFGPGGYLYIARGEGKTPCDRAQTLRPAQLPANDDNDPLCPADPAFSNAGGNPNSRALQGKILRIDVNATTPAGSNELCASSAGGSANYAIPPGNPYAGSAGTAGNCDEIWASASGIPSASASTARPATSTSATSARSA